MNPYRGHWNNMVSSMVTNPFLPPFKGSTMIRNMSPPLLSLWRYDITLENTLKYTIIKYVAYISHYVQAT